MNARIAQQLRNSIHYLYDEKMRTKVDVFAFSLHDFNTYGVFVACTAHANQFQMEKEEKEGENPPDRNNLAETTKAWNIIEKNEKQLKIFWQRLLFSMALV